MMDEEFNELLAEVQRKNKTHTSPKIPQPMQTNIEHTYPPTNVLQYSIPTSKQTLTKKPILPTTNNQHTLGHPRILQGFPYTPIKSSALQHVMSLPNQKINHIIPKQKVPLHKKITYANMVCDYWHLKAEKYRVRLTVRGNQLEYHSDAASPAASLLETKLMINSVIFQSARGC